MMLVNNNQKRLLLIYCIFLVVYNVIAFVLPFQRESGFWTGYVFGLVAIVLATLVCLFTAFGKDLQSKFFRIPLVKLVWRFFVIQLVLSFLEMIYYGTGNASPAIPYQFAIVINVIVLAVCLIGLIGVNAGRENIEFVDLSVKEKTSFAKSSKLEIDDYIARISDANLKKKMISLSEIIRFSDPVSNDKVADLESIITVKTTLLSESIEIAEIETTMTLCDELQKHWAERNRMIKASK